MQVPMQQDTIQSSPHNRYHLPQLRANSITSQPTLTASQLPLCTSQDSQSLTTWHDWHDRSRSEVTTSSQPHATHAPNADKLTWTVHTPAQSTLSHNHRFLNPLTALHSTTSHASRSLSASPHWPPSLLLTVERIVLISNAR
jgi:hypothetical protein